MPAPLPPPPPLDLDALGAVALWREMLPNGEFGYLREFATDEPYVALHSATYAALVAELRAARERENAVHEVLAAISTESGCPTGTGFDDGCETCRWLMDLRAALSRGGAA